MMLAACPNDPTHQTFLTTIRIDEVWRVSERGDLYEATADRDILDGPNPRRLWTCEACGARATIE